MRCPFLLLKERKKIPIYDEAGYKIGDREEESWNVSPCIGEECEIYDKEDGRCAIMSILFYLKNGGPDFIKKIDKSLFERAEMLSVVLSSGLQHMEEATKQSSDRLSVALEKQEGILKGIMETLEFIKKNMEEKTKEEEVFYK